MRRAILLSAAMAAALVLASGAALAYTLIGETADPGAVGANGRIWSIVAAGETVYLGGAFTQVTDTDGKTYTRNNLAAIDANTGRLLQGWNPNATRTPAIPARLGPWPSPPTAAACSWVGPSAA